MLFWSCHDPQRAHKETCAHVTKQLLEECSQIETFDDLLTVKGRLSELFDELVDAIIQARKWELAHPDSYMPSEEEIALSEELRKEMDRLYRIPGAQYIIERCEHKALEKLDAFERKQGKER